MEWIPIDCTLGEKPEVLELIEITGQPVEVVVYRMIRLWSWASLNTADGRIRATPRRLASLLGGDEVFWSAVETVGWVSFDAAGVMTIAGWERRFGSAAKARALKNRRQAKWRRAGDGGASLGGDGREARARLPEETRREEKTLNQPPAEVPTSVPPAAARSRAQAASRVLWTADGGWSGITDEDRRDWSAAYPGAVLADELARATAWLKANPTRAGKRNWRAFLVRWLQRCQDRGGSHGVRPAAADGESVEHRNAVASARWRRVDPVVAEAVRLKAEKQARLRDAGGAGGDGHDSS